MKLWHKITLAIILLIGLFAMTAPASLITEALPENSAKLSLSGFQGKAINGSLKQISMNGITISNVQWDLNVISSLTGTPKALLTVDDPAIKVQSDLTFKHDRHWSVANLNGTLMLQKLATAIPALRQIKPSGTAQLEQLNIALEETAFTAGNGEIEWQDAELVLNNYRFDLGTMTGELRLQGDSLLLDYRSDSRLAPTGTITLSPAGDYEMSMEIQPSALPTEVQWVTRMGKETPSGAVAYTMKGRLR